MLKNLIAMTVASCLIPALASPILPNGSYQEFVFGAAPSPVTGCAGGCTATVNPVAEQLAAPPWTFFGPARLLVLDLFAVGDRFQVFDAGTSLGATSVIANSGLNDCGNDISCALADPLYSRGAFSVGAGSHAITISVIQNAAFQTSGAAVFSASPLVVPEVQPFRLAWAGLSLMGALSWARRKRP